MKNYFGSDESEFCYPEEYWQNYMKHNELSEIDVHPAKRIYGSDFIFCAENNQVGEKGNCSDCPDYTPLNGVKGICKYNKPVYEPADKKITLKLKI